MVDVGVEARDDELELPELDLVVARTAAGLAAAMHGSQTLRTLSLSRTVQILVHLLW